MTVTAREVLNKLKPTAADVRKNNRLLARAVALEVIRGGDHRLATLDMELMPTDRVMQRWSVSIGSGLPRDEWDDDPRSRPPPLDDVTATVVDQIVLRAPTRTKGLIKDWYKTPAASTVIANRMGISRSGLYLEWRAALTYVKFRALESKHADLIKLVKSLI